MKALNQESVLIYNYFTLLTPKMVVIIMRWKNFQKKHLKKNATSIYIGDMEIRWDRLFLNTEVYLVTEDFRQYDALGSTVATKNPTIETQAEALVSKNGNKSRLT